MCALDILERGDRGEVHRAVTSHTFSIADSCKEKLIQLLDRHAGV